MSSCDQEVPRGTNALSQFCSDRFLLRLCCIDQRRLAIEVCRMSKANAC